MAYDGEAFLRHQVARGMSFQALCRAYGAQPRQMQATLRRAGLLEWEVPGAPAFREPAATAPWEKAAEGSPEGAAGPRVAGAVRGREVPTERQERLYQMLAEAAAQGRPSPSRRELAADLGVKPASLPAMLAQLEALGLVACRRSGRHPVYEIAASGRCTRDQLQGAAA